MASHGAGSSPARRATAPASDQTSRSEGDSRRALERLHEAQRIGLIGDWAFDLADATISWSAQVYEITGRDPADGPPQTYDEMLAIFEPDSAWMLRQHVDRAVETGQPQSYEMTLLRPDGARVHVAARAVVRTDEHGNVVALTGTIQDVTARNRAERLLLESEQRLGFALEAAEIGDWDMDLRTNVTRRSLRHDQCFGYREPVAEWGYGTFLAHVDAQDRGKVDTCFRAAMAAGGDYDVEFRVAWPDGSVHWLWSKGRFFFDESGEPYRVAGIQVDVTGRRREVEAALRLAAIVESSEDAIVSQDLAGLVISWNPGAERLFGRAAAQMLGRGLDELVAPGATDDEQAHFALATRGEAVAPFEAQRRRGDGTVLDVLLTLSPLRDVDGDVVGVSTIVRDIGDRKRLESTLRHQALHDTLTGLPNRALLDDRMGHALTIARARGSTVAVLFLDLDRFKVLNDAEGHAAGDAVLVEVAHRLSAAVRPQDTVARFGGDEFVVLCETGGLATAHQVAEHLHESLAHPFHSEGPARFLAASIGIAMAHRDSTAADLLRDADAAMYRAKDLGRGRTAVFDADIRARASARLEATTALRRALCEGELRLHYQPVVDLADERLLGFEALVRWQHPEHGLLGPGAFIADAEETGLIVPLGEWVLRTALEQSTRWAATTGTATPHMAVNLSARQLEEPDLADLIATALAADAFPASALTLEITESVVMQDVLRNVEHLRALREIGVDLSIDDFGTGYSSLVYLKRLPVTTLKIDREFVDGLGQDPHDSAIVAAVIAMARALELRVVAEGVETPRQLAELRRLGCDAAQGFLFSRPVPAEEAERWVQAGRAPTPPAQVHEHG